MAEFNPMNLHAVYDRPILFSTDLVHFIFRENQIDWLPVGCRFYCSNPLSPFTLHIGEAIKIVIRNCQEEFRIRSTELYSSEGGDERRAFLEHATNTLQLPFAVGRGDVKKLFETIAYVARLSIPFYRSGMTDIPDISTILIADAISQYIKLNGAGLYCTFSGIADELIGADSR